MSDESDGKTVLLRLSAPQALVFFEWLVRSGEEKNLTFVDHAEELVLWKLEAQLESTLVEVIAPNYNEAVVTARKAVREALEDSEDS